MSTCASPAASPCGRHCIDLEFAEREYSDIDLVGLSEQREELRAIFGEHGYVENHFVARATQQAQLQFIRREAVPAALPGMRRRRMAGRDRERPPADESETAVEAPQSDDGPQPDGRQAALVRPIVDHVDVFLDVMKMDHDIDITGRLEVDDYAISPADALIAKAQIGRINHKDVHDIIALLKDLPLREYDDDLSIYVPHIAETCASRLGPLHRLHGEPAGGPRLAGDYGLSDERDGARARACRGPARGDRGRGEDRDAGSCARGSASACRGATRSRARPATCRSSSSAATSTRADPACRPLG